MDGIVTWFNIAQTWDPQAHMPLCYFCLFFFFQGKHHHSPLLTHIHIGLFYRLRTVPRKNRAPLKSEPQNCLKLASFGTPPTPTASYGHLRHPPLPAGCILATPSKLGRDESTLVGKTADTRPPPGLPESL